MELILARGLMANIATPSFLVDPNGKLVFFNVAAGKLLGLRYEEAGPMEITEWGTMFVPMTADGRPLEIDELPLSVALREERPVHMNLWVRTPQGEDRIIAVSAFPIVGNAGVRGALAIFWEAQPD